MKFSTLLYTIYIAFFLWIRDEMTREHVKKFCDLSIVIHFLVFLRAQGCSVCVMSLQHRKLNEHHAVEDFKQQLRCALHERYSRGIAGWEGGYSGSWKRQWVQRSDGEITVSFCWLLQVMSGPLVHTKKPPVFVLKNPPSYIKPPRGGVLV